MLASSPASMLNQNRSDLGILNRFSLISSRSRPLPMESTPRIPGRVFALALGLTALITPLAVHLFFPVIPAVKVSPLKLSAVAPSYFNSRNSASSLLAPAIGGGL